MVTCKICGSGESAGSFVYCMRCYTPHHQDCWAYNKTCSIFGCGARTYSDYYPPPPEIISIDNIPDPSIPPKEHPLWAYLGMCVFAMLAVGFGILMGVLAVSVAFGSAIRHDPIFRIEDRIVLPQNHMTGEDSEK